MPLKSKKIEKYLKNSVIVRVYDEIDSTNNEAKRRAAADRGITVLHVTDCQTAGRGRHGHSFYSPKGSGLYFTLSLPLSGDPADVQMITCAAAVAVCEAIAALSDQRPAVKWVNDIFIDGKKVAGILAELIADKQNHPIAVIVGIGINLTTSHFPAEFAATAGSVGKIDPNRLCAETADRLTDMYRGIAHFHSDVAAGLDSPIREAIISDYTSDLYNSIIEKYKALNFCLGKIIRYTNRDGIHTAIAIDIAADGSLIVDENGIQRSLHSGEISIKTE